MDTSGKPHAWAVNDHVRYPAVRPIIPDLSRSAQYLSDTYALRYFSNFGPASIAFEEACEKRWFAPSQRSVLCANATAGLTAALLAVRAKGLVAIPAYTFPATYSAVRGANLEPLIIDVDAATGLMDVERLAHAARQTPIGAVMPVRPHGIWRDMSDLKKVADSIGAPLIIDNAAGLGVDRSIVASTSPPDSLEVFSLHATKTFAVGEGGLIVSPASLEDDVRSAINFGLWSRGNLVSGEGFNGKASEFTAAMALAALEDIEGHLGNRRHQAIAFRENFKTLDGWRSIAPLDPRACTWAGFPIIAPTASVVQRIVELARSEGLVLRRYYYPALPAPNAPVADDLANRSITLPIYADMLDDERREVWSIFARCAAAA